MTTITTAPPTGKPRKRVTPVWRCVWFRTIIVALLLVLAGGSGWWMFRTGVLGQLAGSTKWQIISVSAQAGFRIEEVLVVGRKNTERDHLLRALGTARGSPILAFDVARAKERVELLPWVRSASVERMLPNTILLTVEERLPLALWQNEGQFSLIDYEGTIIRQQKLENYQDLLIVIGPDAPQHSARLIEILGSQPELMSLVRAAIRVGARRWNLDMVGGISVQLPEENVSAAWMHLAQYQRSHGVLERDVGFVDLRLPDRLIVRKATTGEVLPAALGQET